VHVEAHCVGERLNVAGTARVHDSQEGLPCSLAVEAKTSSRRTLPEKVGVVSWLWAPH
jgi:hypothetical protein